MVWFSDRVLLILVLISFQLKTRVAFHEHLVPVCLPPANKELKPGTLCTVIGWGKREDKSASKFL